MEDCPQEKKTKYQVAEGGCRVCARTSHTSAECFFRKGDDGMGKGKSPKKRAHSPTSSASARKAGKHNPHGTVLVTTAADAQPGNVARVLNTEGQLVPAREGDEEEDEDYQE